MMRDSISVRVYKAWWWTVLPSVRKRQNVMARRQQQISRKKRTESEGDGQREGAREEGSVFRSMRTLLPMAFMHHKQRGSPDADIPHCATEAGSQGHAPFARACVRVRACLCVSSSPSLPERHTRTYTSCSCGASTRALLL